MGRSPKFILRTIQKTNTHGITTETEMSTVVDNNTHNKYVYIITSHTS